VFDLFLLQVLYVDQVAEFVAEFKPSVIYLYSGINTDSKTEGTPASFDGIDAYTVDTEILHPSLFEARVVKSEEERTVLRYANKISSEAHIEVMRKVCWIRIPLHKSITALLI
jgi:Xaa-Pro dipeptidase